MKQKLRLLLILLSISFSHFSIGQTTPPPGNTTTTHITTTIRNVPLDTNEIIYDETGKGLRFYQSQKLINSGDYIIKSSGPPGQPGTVRRIVKISEAEQIANYERVKSFIAIPGTHLKENQPLDVTPLLNAVNKKDIENKVIILIFWYADCPPCTESFDAINDFFTQIHNPENILILAIGMDSESVLAAKLKEKPLFNAKLLSNGRNIARAYELNTFPAYVVTDRDHIIRFAARGVAAGSLAAFKNSIRTVLYQ